MLMLKLIPYKAPNDRKKSLKIFRSHFKSEEIPCVVSLYRELTNI